ncbi:MAG: MFS transporter [Pyrinomonas methylaliphatogenes]|nr:MFS transporter [Pyrinomonas methylaliphatogenes]
MRWIEKPFESLPTAKHYPLYALALLTLVNLLNYIDRQVLPAVAPLMLRDETLHLTDSELGYIEAALLLSFTFFAPIFGLLGDRFRRTRLITVAALIWSLATAATGLIPQLVGQTADFRFRLPVLGSVLSGAAVALCFIRALVGIGESAYSTITPSLIADYFTPRRRATALGIFQAAIPIGFSLGFVIGGVLAHFFGWRVAFTLVGLPGIVTAISIWNLREPHRGALDGFSDSLAPKTKISWWTTIERILSTRDWLLSTIGYTALTAALGAFATWATVLLARDKGMPEASAAITLGIITLIGGAIGTFGGGWLADLIPRRRSEAYFSVCAVSTLLAIAPTLVALAADDQRVYLPATFIAVVLLFISNAPLNAILLQCVPPEERATAVALNIVAIHAFGDAISRAAVGVLSDLIGNGSLPQLAAIGAWLRIDPAREHLSVALLIAPASLVISTLFFFWGALTTKRSAL